jgi:hypothetical protein
VNLIFDTVVIQTQSPGLVINSPVFIVYSTDDLINITNGEFSNITFQNVPLIYDDYEGTVIITSTIFRCVGIIHDYIFVYHRDIVGAGYQNGLIYSTGNYTTNQNALFIKCTFTSLITSCRNGGVIYSIPGSQSTFNISGSEFSNVSIRNSTIYGGYINIAGRPLIFEVYIYIHIYTYIYGLKSKAFFFFCFVYLCLCQYFRSATAIFPSRTRHMEERCSLVSQQPLVGRRSF